MSNPQYESFSGESSDFEPSTFTEFGCFMDGLAVVNKNGKFGYINKTGKMVIAPEFDGALNFSEGMAAVLR